ncbi:hypothetical protein Tco_0776304 [Tanacetum coccineum]
MNKSAASKRVLTYVWAGGEARSLSLCDGSDDRSSDGSLNYVTRRRKQGSRGDDVGWRCVVVVALGMVVTSGGDGVDGGYGDGVVARLR